MLGFRHPLKPVLLNQKHFFLKQDLEKMFILGIRPLIQSLVHKGVNPFSLVLKIEEILKQPLDSNPQTILSSI